MSGPAVLLIAAIDDGMHAHGAQRRRALERLGCTVTTVELQRKAGLLSRFGGSDLASRVAKTIEQASPDLVLVIGGDELPAERVAELKARAGAVWVNWFPWDLRGADHALAVAGPYDHLFAIGSDLAEGLAGRLHRPVGHLPCAADPSVYRPVRSRDQYRANVVFAGRATPRREALLQRVLEFGIAVWGPGWRKTALRDYCRGEVLTTEEFVRAYGGATVALNIHHTVDDAGAVEASCNQRLFELAAIGVPQVVDHRADLALHFDADWDLAVFHDEDGLRRSVETIVQDPAGAQDMAERARETVLARHTYMHRMQALLHAVLGV